MYLPITTPVSSLRIQTKTRPIRAFAAARCRVGLLAPLRSVGRIAEFFFTEATPGLLAIPPGVWHADQNWGKTDAHIVNFPTHPYDHANPDKFRIDPHSDVIPFDWELRDG